MGKFVIKIDDATVDSREVNGPRGKFDARSQQGFAELPNGERRHIRVRLQRDQKAYQPGLYTIADSSYGVSQYGDIEMSRVELVPVAGKV